MKIYYVKHLKSERPPRMGCTMYNPATKSTFQLALGVSYAEGCYRVDKYLCRKSGKYGLYAMYDPMHKTWYPEYDWSQAMDDNLIAVVGPLSPMAVWLTQGDELDDCDILDELWWYRTFDEGRTWTRVMKIQDEPWDDKISATEEDKIMRRGIPIKCPTCLQTH